VLDSLEVPDPEKDYRVQSAMHTTNIIRNKLGSDKFLYMTLVSPFTLVGELRGVENLMLDMYDEPDFVHDLLSFAEDVVKVYSEYLTTWGVDGVILCDPTASADLISKEDFETFSKHYLKAPIKVIRDAGTYVLLHICGNTSDRLDTIGDLDIDVFSLDFLVDLAYARETLGTSPTLLGNVNPAETLFNGTADKVATEARACIEKTEGRSHILGAGCDIAPGSPMANVEALKTVVNRT
jgi:MtaA/CmuA family methyltransferase